MEAAQTELDPALARAAELGYAPLDVAARLVQGELQDARSEYAAARETLEATYFDAHRLGADEVAAAASTALVAIVGAELSDPDAGAIWSRMAAATVDRAGIGPSPTLFDATAIVERARGRYEQAERLHRQAFELDEARGDELAAAGSLNGLAIDHQKLGRWKDALADSKRALEIFTRVLGAEHPKASAARLNMANVLVNLGRYDEAHVEAELATDNLVLVFGEVHAHVAAAETTVAFVHTASSRPDLALPHQLKAVEIYEQVHGPKHPWVGRALANVAGAQAALGHFEEAQAGFERALGILREALGPDHPDLALLASGLADVHVRRGDLQAAVSAYDESAALRARTVGEDHPGFGLVLDTRAEVLRRLGRMEEACRDHARALAIIGAKVGDEAFDMMGPHIGLAACARHDGDHAKAATHLRRAIAIAQKTMEAEDPRLLDLRAQLNALPVGPGG
jgi:tetratricopeptide (TPR) repeat protein